MKTEIITCDIKQNEGYEHSPTTTRLKISVMFDHDQEDGKSKTRPYFETKELDICEHCFDEMTETGKLIYAYGAMGYNTYSFLIRGNNPAKTIR